MQDKRTVLQRELDKVRTQIAELEKIFEERPDYVWSGQGEPGSRAPAS